MMKLSMLLLLGLSCLLGVQAQIDIIAGTSCGAATRFCFETDAVFNAEQNDAPNIPRACLDSSPNPAWFWFELASADPSSKMEFTISMTDKSSGEPKDVDFAVWGPFDDLPTAKTYCPTLDDNDHNNDLSLLAQDSDFCSTTCDACSFATADAAPIETARINAASGNVGDVYLMLISNFADVDGIISINQQTNAGTECGCNDDELCTDLEDVSNCPGDCDNVDNLGGFCGDNVCRGDENNINCERDCGDVVHYWGFAVDTVDGTQDDIQVNIVGATGESGWYTISTDGALDESESFFVLPLTAVFVGAVENFQFRLSGGDAWTFSSMTITAPGHYVYRLGSSTISSSESNFYVSTPSAGYWDITTTTGSKVINGADRAGTTHAIFMNILGSSDSTGWILLTGYGFAASEVRVSRFSFSWDIGVLVSHQIYIMGNTDGWLFFSFGWFASWGGGASYSYVATGEEWWGYHDEFSFWLSRYSREYTVTFIECGTLSFSNGVVNYISGTTFYGSTATFTCNTDYVLDGSDNECLCMANGQWECGGYCRYAPPPSSSPSPTGKPNTPSASFSASPSMKPSSSGTDTPSRTPTASSTRTSTRTPTGTPTNTPTRSATRSASRTPSRSRSISSTRTPSRSASYSSSSSASMTGTPTPSISVSPSSSYVSTCTPTPEPTCGCDNDCGCGCGDSPLTQINVNFEGMFRGINF